MVNILNLFLWFVSTGLVCMKSSTSVVELVMLLCSQVSFFFFLLLFRTFFPSLFLAFSRGPILLHYGSHDSFMSTVCADLLHAGFYNYKFTHLANYTWSLSLTSEGYILNILHIHYLYIYMLKVLPYIREQVIKSPLKLCLLVYFCFFVRFSSSDDIQTHTVL